MIKTGLTGVIFAGFILAACQQQHKSEKQSGVATGYADSTAHDIIRKTLRNEAGLPLDMSFDNTDHTATVTFQGTVIQLQQQQAGSGIWYTNEQYELRGKGNDITLTKDGAVIFKTAEDEL